MNEADEKLLTEITEQSTEMWMGIRDRAEDDAAPIIICQNPERAYYLTRAERYLGDPANINGWVVEERPLQMSDAAEFFATFGSHWSFWLGATVRDAPFRAFIKNGRKEEWSISLDVKTKPVSVANSISDLTFSLTRFQHNMKQAEK